MRLDVITIIALVKLVKESFGYSPIPSSSRLLSRQTNVVTYPPKLHTNPSPRRISSNISTVHVASTSGLFFSASSNDGECSSPLDNNTNITTNKNILSRIKRLLIPESAEKMSTKELFAKMGLSALLSYGFVSNMSYCVSVSLAYFAFTTKVNMILT